MVSPPRWIVGDVTDVEEYTVGGGFSLFLDIGCLFGLPTAPRVAVIHRLDALAASHAQLLRFGFTHRDDEERTYGERWRRLSADPTGPRRSPWGSAVPRWTRWEHVNGAS